MSQPSHEVIGGPATIELAGAYLRYRYSTGAMYTLRFDAERVTFVKLPGPQPDPVDGKEISLSYRARKIREDLYLVHWLSPDRSAHVSLLLDTSLRQLHVSALMPGRIEFFDVAQIEQLTLPGA